MVSIVASALSISILTVNFSLHVRLPRKLQSEIFEKILLFNCSMMVIN